MAVVSYDRDADALYIELAAGAEGPDTEGQEVHPGVMLMFDANGRIIGREITSVSKILPPGAVDNLPIAVELKN